MISDKINSILWRTSLHSSLTSVALLSSLSPWLLRKVGGGPWVSGTAGGPRMALTATDPGVCTTEMIPVRMPSKGYYILMIVRGVVAK